MEAVWVINLDNPSASSHELIRRGLIDLAEEIYVYGAHIASLKEGRILELAYQKPIGTKFTPGRMTCVMTLGYFESYQVVSR